MVSLVGKKVNILTHGGIYLTNCVVMEERETEIVVGFHNRGMDTVQRSAIKKIVEVP